MSTWLSPEDYRRVQDTVPLACVDVVALRMRNNLVNAIGLIRRDTPHQGPRWCLVGGRVFRNESLAEAAARHLRHTLGDEVRFSLEPDAQPIYVAQYFTSTRGIGVVDPRHHSVAMNYCVPLDGTISAQGEAHEFRWFTSEQLPGTEEFGFEQDKVLYQCLRRAGISF